MRRNSRRNAARSAATSAICIALTVFGGEAIAQSASDVATRRVLIEQAQQASTAGDHARALDLLERAGQLEMSPSLRMFLADEQAAVGHFLDALGTAEVCERTAMQDRALANRDTILTHCRAVEVRARQRLATVNVSIAEPNIPGLSVRIGGRVLNPALYGVAGPVQSGTVVIEATAEGRPPYRSEMTLAPGATGNLRVVFAPPATATATTTTRTGTTSNVVTPTPTPVAAAPTATAPVARTAPTNNEHTDSTSSSGGIRVAPIAVMAVGVVGLVGAGVFFALRNSALSGCQTLPDRYDCPDEATFNAAQTATSWNLATNVALGVGVAALAVGAVWFIVGGGHSEQPARRASLFVSPRAGGAEFGLVGRF